MKILDICQSFYSEIGEPAIKEAFPAEFSQMAIGLAGSGSECFGYDDDTSRDHDTYAGFIIWLPDELEKEIGFKLSALYDRLPGEYMGLKTEHRSRMGDGKLGVKTISSFYSRFTGSAGAPESWQQWLALPSWSLAQAVNGRVFYDGLGEFSSIRRQISAGMPEDVWKKKIAAKAALMAQSGQYNYSRCLRHGEPAAAMLAVNEFVTNALELAFLLSHRFMPFYKWAFRAMAELPDFAETRQSLEALLFSSENKEQLIEQISVDYINRLKALGLTHGSWDYLEPHAYEVMETIKSPEIRSLHVMEG